MERIVIKSIGTITAMESDDEIQKIHDKKTRRMNYISKLLLSAVKSCLERYEQKNELDYSKTGIIVNTGYGPMNTILEYADAISSEEADLASPTVFANTVYNSMIGHVAIYYNFKGPSTLLMGSNSLFLVNHLLHKKSAIDILACGVEEYCKPVYEYLEEKYGNSVLNQGAGALLLSNEGESEYGYIVGGAESALGYNPYITISTVDATVKFKDLITRCLDQSKVEDKDIDCIFLCSDRFSGLRVYEEEAIRQIFGNEIHKEYIKDKIGDTLGAGTTLSISIAAIGMKDNQYHKVLVLGIEVTGTLEAFVLSKE